jgi:hypothetical protein
MHGLAEPTIVGIVYHVNFIELGLKKDDVFSRVIEMQLDEI